MVEKRDRVIRAEWEAKRDELVKELRAKIKKCEVCKLDLEWVDVPSFSSPPEVAPEIKPLGSPHVLCERVVALEKRVEKSFAQYDSRIVAFEKRVDMVAAYDERVDMVAAYDERLKSVMYDIHTIERTVADYRASTRAILSSIEDQLQERTPLSVRVRRRLVRMTFYWATKIAKATQTMAAE